MKKYPSSITVEEAVAFMVNMDYIPAGLTLLEMLEAFSEEAEVEYENALIDRLPDDKMTPLKLRLDSCRARISLTKLLLKNLQYEVDHPESLQYGDDHPENPKIVLADESSSKQRLTFESISEWAAKKYGIGISARPVDKKLENVRWEDITIKIKENNKIGYKIKKGRFTYKHLKEVDLMGKKRPEPNKKYNILLGLSIKGKTFGSGKQAENKNSKAIYEVGCALKKLIPLPDGPFHGFNPDDGWKPRFKIESFLTDNDEYYRKDDFHFSLDESRDGNDDDDDNYDDNE